MQSPVSSTMARTRRLRLWPFAIAALVLAAAAGAPRRDSPTTVRVGYFPNLTHSQALIGLARGDFQHSLGTRLNEDNDFQRRAFRDRGDLCR